jgi:hypothetical protein
LIAGLLAAGLTVGLGGASASAATVMWSRVLNDASHEAQIGDAAFDAVFNSGNFDCDAGECTMTPEGRVLVLTIKDGLR